MKPTVLTSFIAAASLLAATSASAAVYTQNFTFPDGTTDFGDGSILASAANNASVQGGALRLTNDALTSEAAGFKIPALPNSSLGWTASFDLTIIDGDPGAPPADGLSFSWGAIPMDTTLPQSSQGFEHGWAENINHLAFEIDTWENGAGGGLDDNGLRIASAMGGIHTHHAQVDGDVLADNSSVSGSVVITWDPVLGASFSTTDFLTNANLTNIPIPGFTGNDAFIFAFSARTGFAEETLLIDNLVVTTVPETSSSLLAVLAGLGLMSIRRRK